MIVVALAAAALFAAYHFWFRDSSLVAVKSVRVIGTGNGRLQRQLADELTVAARKMTTLHVDQSALADVARRFTVVQSVSADPSFPSSLSIHVVERRPAALIGTGSGAVAVAADGVILRGLPAAKLRLPQLPISSTPKGPRLRGPVLEQARVLGAAPGALLGHVDHSFNGDGGVGVSLDGGVQLSFGDAAHAAEKWRAAAAVLSDPQLGPLDYVDLSVPSRPAVGGSSHSPPPLAAG
jgi:cell division septal protein FtsQ